MSKIHLGILDEERRGVFKQLSQFKKFGYLAGGTGLALQINHRKSFDFDIFVDKPISTSLKKMVKDVFGDVDYYVNSEDQISFKTSNNIQVTFLWYYFPLLFPLIPTGSLPIAAIKDISADKVHTIGRRAAWRDYVDLFFLIKGGLVSIDELVELAHKKFKGEFNEALFLPQLSYFGDVEELAIEFVDKPCSNSEIKSFLESQVLEYTKKRFLPVRE